MTPLIVVTAAVVQRHGTYLVTRRLQGTHLAGLWEFPGGKCEPGESHQDCLRREVREELGVDVHVHERVLSTVHDYGVKRVELHFFACDITGEPEARLGQEIRWVEAGALRRLDFPAADAELIALLAGGEP